MCARVCVQTDGAGEGGGEGGLVVGAVAVAVMGMSWRGRVSALSILGYRWTLQDVVKGSCSGGTETER